MLTITPPAGADNLTHTPVESNGAGLLEENADGSAMHIEIGILSDNKNDNNEAVYELATDADGTDNNQFEIVDGTNTGEKILQFKGADAGDFETGDQLSLKIERYNSKEDAEAERSPQKLEYIVNLKNTNDNAPEPIGYLPDGTTEIDNIAAGKVGNDLYEMVLKLPANGDPITIDFERGGSTLLLIEPEYAVADDPTSKVIKFVITTGIVGYTGIAAALTGDTALRDANTDFTVWDEYVSSVTYIGSAPGGPPSSSALFSSDVTLTAKATLEVDEGTTGAIAKFASTDADGDLNPLTFADLTGDDAALFTFDKDTGELSFLTAPSYDSATPANNTRVITVTVTDVSLEANRGTYELIVVVKDVE